MLNRFMSCLVALMPLVAAAPAAAQQYMHREDLPMHERQRLEGEKRSKEAADAGYARQQQVERDRQQRALLKKPPLPAERNGLLGSWRLGDGQRSSVGGLGRETGGGGLGGIVEMLSSMRFEKMACEAGFSSGITFAPASYSGGGIAGVARGAPIAYRSARSGDKQFTVAIPGDGNMMVFEIASPNRIVSEDGCVLVRVGAAAANAEANAPPAAGARPQVAAIAPSLPPPTLSRPPPEVCRNTMIDRLGAVRIEEVQQMTKARFRETLTGMVPNSTNLRLDARASVCDDPRINARLYDFDGAGVLQSVTIVWARPPGTAPALLFKERAVQLARWFDLAAPTSPTRVEGRSAMARVVLEDWPERNLLLEAYVAPR